MRERGRFAGLRPATALLVLLVLIAALAARRLWERVRRGRRHDDDHRVPDGRAHPQQRLPHLSHRLRAEDRHRGQVGLLARPAPAAADHVRHLPRGRGARGHPDAQPGHLRRLPRHADAAPRGLGHGPRQDGRPAGRRRCAPGATTSTSGASSATACRCRTRPTGSKTHGTVARPQLETCRQCHQPDFCLQCHPVEMPHPLGLDRQPRCGGAVEGLLGVHELPQAGLLLELPRHADAASRPTGAPRIRTWRRRSPVSAPCATTRRTATQCHQIHQTHTQGGGS